MTPERHRPGQRPDRKPPDRGSEGVRAAPARGAAGLIAGLVAGSIGLVVLAGLIALAIAAVFGWRPP